MKNSIQASIDEILESEMDRLLKVSKKSKTPMHLNEFKKMEIIQKIDRLSRELPTEITKKENPAEKLSDDELLTKMYGGSKFPKD